MRFPAPVRIFYRGQRAIRIFFVVDLNDTDFVRYTPPGSTRKDTVVLAVGKGGDAIFAVQFGKRKQILFSPGRIPGPVQKGPYSLKPFLSLLDTIHDWSTRGSPAGPDVALGSGGPTTAQTTAAHQLLSKVGEGYLACRNALAKRTPVPAIANMQVDAYHLGEYGADIELRLQKDGSLSEKPDQETFRLQLRVRVKASDQPTAEVTLSPAGFFASGPLYDSFLDNLASFGGSPFLAQLLGSLIRENSFEARRLRAQEFARSARNDSAIVLSGSGMDAPLYVLLLRGRLYDEPATLLCVAEFRTESPTTVSWNVEGIKEPLATFTGEAGNITIDRSGADYIFPIIENIKRWGELL